MKISLNWDKYINPGHWEMDLIDRRESPDFRPKIIEN